MHAHIMSNLCIFKFFLRPITTEPAHLCEQLSLLHIYLPFTLQGKLFSFLKKFNAAEIWQGVLIMSKVFQDIFTQKSF